MFAIGKLNKIIMTVGDNAEMAIQIIMKESGEEYTILPTDSVVLTVKKTVSSPAVITKTANSDGKIIFEPSDTLSLTSGLYVYDVQLTTGSGAVYTVVPTSFFELCAEVS